jgi:hypothetical protein
MTALPAPISMRDIARHGISGSDMLVRTPSLIRETPLADESAALRGDGSTPHAISPAQNSLQKSLQKSLHEFYAARHADAVSLSGSALLLAEGDRAQTRLWVRHAGQNREAGYPSPAGLAELGLDPARLVLVDARDAPSALQAGLEGARCAALGRRDSGVYEKMINEGRVSFLSAPVLQGMLEGGVPITINGHVVGAVGVSGVKSTEDAQIAQAGIAALG